MGAPATRSQGWNRPIKDDIGDHAHGTLDMQRAIAVSCNAYFAQLGVHDVGSKALAETAALMGISTGDMARTAQGAAVRGVRSGAGADFAVPDGARGRYHRGGRAHAEGPLDPEDAGAATRRRVLLDSAQADVPGRGHAPGGDRGNRAPSHGRHARQHGGQDRHRAARSGQPHSWFAALRPTMATGAAPGFAVLVEHGGYGARVAAPIAREVMEAAAGLGLMGR